MTDHVFVVADFCGGGTPVQGTFVGVFTDKETAVRVRDEHNSKVNGGKIEYAWGSVEVMEIKLNEASCTDPDDWCECRG